MLKTVVLWNSYLTLLSFILTSLILGGLIVNLSMLSGISGMAPDMNPAYFKIIYSVTAATLLFLILELIIVPARITRLFSGSKSQKELVQFYLKKFSTVYYLRLAIGFIGLLFLCLILFTRCSGTGIHVIAFVLLMAAELSGRFLFYAEQESSSL